MFNKKNQEKKEATAQNEKKQINKKSKSSKKTNKKKLIGKIPKSVQDSIPYQRVYKNGIIEIDDGVFSKSYLLNDVNFSIATQEEQENIFCRYGDLLNTFGAEVGIEITINNRNIDQELFCENTMLKPQHDELNYLREEYNQMLMDKMAEGRNNLKKEKYLTLTIHAEGIEEAVSVFSRLDGEVSTALKKITGMETVPMTTIERLNILYDIYNLGNENAFLRKAYIDSKEAYSFNFDHMVELGLTTKDVIGPEGMHFDTNYFMIGDKYARTLYLDNLPTYLSTEILSDITNTPSNMLLSVHFESLRQDKSIELVRNQLVNINSNVMEAQKRAVRNGYGAELISPTLINAQNDASRLMQDMTKRNQKLFLVTVVVTIFADTKEELEKTTEDTQTTVSKHLCQLKKLFYQQEAAFTSSLPIGKNKIEVKRLLTTESAAVFIPFSAQELTVPGGMYYGLNAVSKNMILYNRLNSRNYNGVILGTPGSGKSFAAKREIVNVLLNTNDDVFILDPEREYEPLAYLLGGEVVKIAAGSHTYINPLDMDLHYGESDDGGNDPVTLKSDFIISLCETIIGGRYGLSPIERSVIDRCVKMIYRPYLEYMAGVRDRSIDFEKMPTLIDFYNLLMAQPEPEAQQIALSLELYCTGSLDNFAHKTNVNTHSRFVIYDIKEIGSGMKEMGLQVCLDAIWNKIIQNKIAGKRTWFYLDEFYLLTQTDSSAKFLQQIWKRARKWGGIPTGITQNVEDLLASKEARTIISNSDFVMMLNQAPLDRVELAKMLNISPTQVSYITNSDPGQGLIYTGKTIVPFIDKFPTDTKLYRVMTTKPDEVLTDAQVKEMIGGK